MKKCFDDLEDLTHTHTDSHRICALNYLLPGKLFLALDRYVTPPPNNPHSGYTHTHTHLDTSLWQTCWLQASGYLPSTVSTDIPLSSHFHNTLPLVLHLSLLSLPLTFSHSLAFFSFSQLAHNGDGASFFAPVNSSLVSFFSFFSRTI